MCLSCLSPCGENQSDTMKNESCSASGFISYRKVARDFFFFFLNAKPSKAHCCLKNKCQAPEHDFRGPWPSHFLPRTPTPTPQPHAPVKTSSHLSPSLPGILWDPPLPSQASAPRGQAPWWLMDPDQCPAGAQVDNVSTSKPL